jgi:hypothetical protein
MGNLDSIYVDPTIEAVHRAIEARAAAEPPRTYLGASSLGDRCERKLYYRLNGAPSEPRKASLIYAAEDGHTSEATVAGRLRLVPGLELWTVDEVGKQFGFTDFGGKFAGHIDGVIKGLIQAPSTPHIWENKAANEKKFAEFRSAIQKYGEKQALMNGNYAWYVLYGLFRYDTPLFDRMHAGGAGYLVLQDGIRACLFSGDASACRTNPFLSRTARSPYRRSELFLLQMVRVQRALPWRNSILTHHLNRSAHGDRWPTSRRTSGNAS